MTASPFAFLPMYDLPPLHTAWDKFWQAVHRELASSGCEAKPELDRSDELFDLWTDPNLLIGQTCGWPFVSMLREQVVPFARLDFGLERLSPGDYQSVFVSSTELAAGSPAELQPLLLEPATRLAVNGLDSQSGYRVLGECVAKPATLGRDQLVLTGSHARSVEAVAQGRADFAAIDAVTWRYLEAFDPIVTKVNVVARSSGVPGLPLITSPQNTGKAQTLFSALEKAITALDSETSKKLGIRGLVPADAVDYAILKDEPFGRVTFA